MRRLVLLSGLALAGCFSPSIPENLPCSETHQCPSDQMCDLTTNLCIRTGGGPPIDAPMVDACVPMAEICNGLNDDCDSAIDEGVSSQTPCDGPDSDLCIDDVMICETGGAGEVCSTGDDTAELCNSNIDDDCDGATDEGFDVGTACDGPDDDACAEGVTLCDGTAAVCDDNTPTNIELCNNFDDDCDGTNDEGFDFAGDPDNCGSCGHQCTNMFGTVACMGGGCAPTCALVAAECDGNPDNGCELLDTNPACNAGGLDFSLPGDQGTFESTQGIGERFVRVQIFDQQPFDQIPLTAWFRLTSPVGIDYNLYVWCNGCGDVPVGNPSDDIAVGQTGQFGGSPGYEVMVEIRYEPPVPATNCGVWSLTIETDIPTPNRCADFQ